ncbi:MAG TPA: nitroreductase family protein [Acidimicrobiales bacterium]|nr:nitroreductase family protein [Acidimicrobiales bacterium]
MDLTDALRTTGSVRDFTDQPVDDKVLFALLDVARFAPSGGNRQSWRVIVVRDQDQRRVVRDIYLDAWHDYVAHLLAGVVPFSPLATDQERASALALRSDAEAASTPDGFAETLDRVPVMLVVCADLHALAASDRDLGRYQIVGGASVYPFVWNLILAARNHGLGGVMTTVATRNEGPLRSVLRIPDHFAVASIVVLGHPVNRPTKLTRRTVQEFATFDTFDGPPLDPA